MCYWVKTTQFIVLRMQYAMNVLRSEIAYHSNCSQLLSSSFILHTYSWFFSSSSLRCRSCCLQFFFSSSFSLRRFSCLFNIFYTISASLSKPLSPQLIHLNVSILENKLYDLCVYVWCITVHQVRSSTLTRSSSAWLEH